MARKNRPWLSCTEEAPISRPKQMLIELAWIAGDIDLLSSYLIKPDFICEFQHWLLSPRSSITSELRLKSLCQYLNHRIQIDPTKIEKMKRKQLCYTKINQLLQLTHGTNLQGRLTRFFQHLQEEATCELKTKTKVTVQQMEEQKAK